MRGLAIAAALVLLARPLSAEAQQGAKPTMAEPPLELRVLGADRDAVVKIGTAPDRKLFGGNSWPDPLAMGKNSIVITRADGSKRELDLTVTVREVPDRRIQSLELVVDEPAAQRKPSLLPPLVATAVTVALGVLSFAYQAQFESRRDTHDRLTRETADFTRLRSAMADAEEARGRANAFALGTVISGAAAAVLWGLRFRSEGP